MNGAVSKKRWLMEIGIGFMLGRVWVFSINPFGLAYLCASGVYPAGRGLVFLSVLAGFITKAKGLDFLHYIMMTGLLWFVQKIMKKVDGKEGSCQAVAAIGGILNVVLSVTTGFLQHGTTSVVFTAALESICLIAFAYVMQWGLRFLLYEDWERELSNEEMISVLVLAALSIYGMPRLFDGVLSIVETMSYLLVLFAGYRYGAAVGAMAGAVGGILSVAGGSDMILIGVYCVLGITVGIFREIGRIVSVITFVAAGIVFAYVIRDEVLGIVELRGMVSAGIVFLAVPRELVRTIETDFMRERENPFAKADLMSLANEKIEEVLGLDQIAVFHINDSLNLLGAHKDRHANIGAGTIGFDPLYKVVHDERFLDVPKILETPWLCAEGETKKTIPPYKEEIARLLR